MTARKHRRELFDSVKTFGPKPKQAETSYITYQWSPIEKSHDIAGRIRVATLAADLLHKALDDTALTEQALLWTETVGLSSTVSERFAVVPFNQAKILLRAMRERSTDMHDDPTAIFVGELHLQLLQAIGSAAQRNPHSLALQELRISTGHEMVTHVAELENRDTM